MRRRAKGFPKPIIITGKRIKGCAAFCGCTPFAFVEYLERQRDRGKAQYLADAILCYEKAGTRPFQQTDRALIEQKHYTEKGLPPADAEALFEKENREYQFFISARILSLASSTFMRERIKVMMASSTKGITRYMSFSILMQESGCTASALS